MPSCGCESGNSAVTSNHFLVVGGKKRSSRRFKKRPKTNKKRSVKKKTKRTKRKKTLRRRISKSMKGGTSSLTHGSVNDNTNYVTNKLMTSNVVSSSVSSQPANFPYGPSNQYKV